MNDLSLPVLSTGSTLNKRQTNPKGSSIMDNLETYATLGYKINDDDKQKKKHNPKTKRIRNTEPTNKIAVNLGAC